MVPSKAPLTPDPALVPAVVVSGGHKVTQLLLLQTLLVDESAVSM